MELNKVMLIGRLTRDPETRFTQSGLQVTNFSLAVNSRRSKDKEEVLFIRVDCWQKTAEIVDKYLKKGSMCLVEGRLKLDEYETKDGQKRQEIRVVADQVVLGPKPGGGQRDGGDGGFTREPARDYDESYDSAPRRNASPPAASESRREEPAETEDDLPF